MAERELPAAATQSVVIFSGMGRAEDEQRAAGVEEDTLEKIDPAQLSLPKVEYLHTPGSEWGMSMV